MEKRVATEEEGLDTEEEVATEEVAVMEAMEEEGLDTAVIPPSDPDEIYHLDFQLPCSGPNTELSSGFQKAVISSCK